MLITALPVCVPPPATKFATQLSDKSITIDGPYVLYRGDSIIVNYIDSANGMLSVRSSQYHLSQKDQVQLVVNTDEMGKTFNVKLQPKLTSEKSTYDKAKKILALSDIEGEFSAFRQLFRRQMRNVFRGTRVFAVKVAAVGE